MNRSMTATLKYALMSSKKLNLVASMVRGRSVADARRFLQFLPKKAGHTLLKAINSATANAENNLDLKVDNLYVESIDVGKGPKLKRVRAVGRGRMHKYEHHRSFLKVTL